MPIDHALRSGWLKRRMALLGTVSAVALGVAAAPVEARSLYSTGASTSAITAATSAALTSAQQSSSVAQQAMNALRQATQAIQAMQAAQAAAHNLALQAPSAIPNGLVAGGLQVAPGAVPGSNLWQNANAPTQTLSAGQTTVTIQQTAPQAILTWQTFNVGKNTTVDFDQQGNSTWVALNRIIDPSGQPSQILGRIKADGQVYLINPNGIIFGGSSQINVGSLIASTADIADSQFLANGIYSTQAGSTYNPSFTDAGGAITVEPGAEITTNTPSSVTQGGGYVLLMGTEVENQGSIVTPDGQTELAAGDSFILRPGYGTTANQTSTTRGNEIAVELNNPGSGASGGSGWVDNSGYIEADTGDITLAGESVVQDGVAYSTTSVNVRGTIHLLSSASDPLSSVTLTGNSLSLILPDTSGATAYNSVRAALISDSATQNASRNKLILGQFDDLSLLADVEDESRIEIVTGGTVDFQNGSTTTAVGGQIAVSATNRVQVDTGALLDVAGEETTLPMPANDVAVDIQGNELRDDPNNRDTGTLFSDTVYVDDRQLIYVPAGTGGDSSDRYYTAGGVLEVSGWLNDTGHTIGEWLASGGSITLSTGSSGAVVAQPGSVFNISGGAIQYQSGYIQQSYLIGSDGRIYNINTAPADITYTGVYQGYADSHPHWGITQYFWSPLIRSQIYEQGYTVGRDAGSLILSTPTSVFDGTVEAGVIDGANQTNARPANVSDPYLLTQTTVPLAGQIDLGQYDAAGFFAPYTTTVAFDAQSADAGSISASDPIPANLVGTVYFDAGQISDASLGGLSIATSGSITVSAPLTFAPGASVKLLGSDIDIAANLTDRGGTISITNFYEAGNTPQVQVDQNGLAQATLEAGVTIDTQGLWTNAVLDPTNVAGLALVNGGAVSIDMSQGVTLASGSVIDTSSGGAILQNGKFQGGAGGNIDLIVDDPAVSSVATAPLILDGTLSAYGVTKGGALTIGTGQSVYIADQPALADNVLAAGQAAPTQLVLAAEVDIPAGGVAPFPVPQSFATDAAGQSLSVGATPTFADNGVGLQVSASSSGWTVPAGLTVVDSSGNQYNAGQIVPAGTLLTSGSGNLPAGYVVPASVFPDGIAINPVTVNVPQGTVLSEPVTLAAGTPAPAGAVFAQNVDIRPLLNLSPSLFESGFSNYSITGGNGVTVAPGTQIDVVEPVYQLTSASYSAPTGSAPGSALSLWTPPLYLPNPQTGQITSRAGASITLDGINLAGIAASPITIGAGALISVDPGQSIDIGSPSQITVDGILRAPSGNISIVDIGGNDNSAKGQSIWIGGDAVLDVSARAVTAVGQFDQTYGVVPNGGSITLGAAGDVLNGADIIESTFDFIVVRPGAVLDASGTSALIDPDAGTTPSLLQSASAVSPISVASNGGAITLSSYSGIYVDGTMMAAAGGPSAAGGALNVTLETPAYGQYDPTAPSFVPRVITLSQAPVGQQLPTDLQPGISVPSLQFGQARFSADTLAADGFGALSFTAFDAIVFDGDVNLAAKQSIAFHEGAIGDTSAAAQVTITAPYVQLDGNTGIDTNVISVYPSLWGFGWQPSTQQSTGSFTIDADLIDVSNQVVFGIDSPATTNSVGTPVTYDYASFANVNLTSQGDIRFLPPTVATERASQLETSGDLTFTAAQLYPVINGAINPNTSGVQPTQAFIVAGAEAGGATDPNSLITIKRISSVDPAVPYSIIGQLTFTAGTIDQGGVIRAPYGDVTFDATNAINLLPGSITSSSMDGLTMLVGGTVDGITWTYAGTTLNNTYTLGGNSLDLDAPSVNVAAGAVIDVSGGGDIAGAGFISGEGGSVNVLTTPLVNANPANTYSSATDQVYAIVPGYQSGYAPVDPVAGAAPTIGQQVTIPSGVPGLPAGTYTLLPANYALLPGGYRVELAGTVTAASALQGAAPTGNGAYVIDGFEDVANTGIRNALPTKLIVMPGSAVRNNSSYDEVNYSAYQIGLAKSVENIRPFLPMDGGTLTFNFNGSPNNGQTALTFDGTALFGPGADAQTGATGQPGQVVVDNQNGDIEVYADAPTQGFSGVSLDVGALDNIAAPSLTINAANGNVTLDSGVDLRAAQVVLIAAANDAITLQPGAEIDTIGMGTPPVSVNGNNSIVALSDAELVVSNADVTLEYKVSPIFGPAYSTINIEDGAKLYSDGSIGFAAGGPVTIADGATFGTADVGFSAADINIGDPAVMASANAPAGFNLTQARLDQLLAGDTSVGAPALQTLTLTASQSVNVFGSVDLDVIDPATGKPDLNLVLNTPAIYGYGSASDSATLTVGTLTWGGVAATNANGKTISAPPGPITANGPGTGSGTFNIVANEITFGFPNNVVPDDQTTYDRVMYGFSQVDMIAPEITSSGKNTLAVYQAQGADPSGPGVGGTLDLETPLLTGAAGSVMSVTAGGVLTIVAPPNGSPAAASATSALGAEIDLAGGSVNVDSAVLLPSGKLTITANGDIDLQSGANLDLAGQATKVIDQTEYSWGGDVVLASANGNILQAAGSVIDISAVDNNAGSLTIQAIGAGAGQVALDGTLKASATLTPGLTADLAGGSISVAAQTLSSGSASNLTADFAALNAALDSDGFSWSRSFDLKEGDLTIGNEVVAHQVSVSIDNGSLTIEGTINASGITPGSISLAAADNLTLNGVLDAHGTVLQKDSYGNPIDAENAGTVNLTAVAGLLTLSGGSKIDVSVTTPQGALQAAQGDVELNAPRIDSSTGALDATGDGIDVVAIGTIGIVGARSVALNGFATYKNAPADPNDPNGQIITQAYLDQINSDSQTFMAAVDANSSFQQKIAGLTSYGSIFHLRPGVEIESATPNGDLTVQGDLDLSGYRYSDASNYGLRVNPAVYGSGEPGVLVLRAGGNLTISGSITDGFGAPPSSPDDLGWIAMSAGPVSSDVTLSTGVVLGPGTTFGVGSALGYSIPILGGTLPADKAAPTSVTLAKSYTVPAGTVLTTTLLVPDHFGVGDTLNTQGVDGSGNYYIDFSTPIATTKTAWTVPDSVDVVYDSNFNSYGPGQIVPAGTDIVYFQVSAPYTIPAGTFTDGVSVDFTYNQGTKLASAITLPAGTQLSAGTVFPTTAYIQSLAELQQNAVIPAGLTVTLAADYTLSSSIVAGGTIVTPTRTYTAGQTIPVGTILPTGTTLGAGAQLPFDVAIDSTMWPAGDTLSFTGDVTTYANVSVAAGSTIPAGADLVGPSGPYGASEIPQAGHHVYALAPMLAAGDLSWSMQLGAGADTTAASASVLQSAAQLAGSGNLTLNDPHAGDGIPGFFGPTPSQSFSVIRTGTGSLSLLAGGNVDEDSPFGIYTAGTQSADVGPNGEDSYNLPRGLNSDGSGTVLGSYSNFPSYEPSIGDYSAYYPAGGGDVLVSVQGDLNAIGGNPVGNWLWTQGGAVAGQDAAWWINFGTYAQIPGGSGTYIGLVGFTGIGTLGGGNVTLDVGGNANGVVAAVASTGRVPANGGSPVETGGGDLVVNVGGTIGTDANGNGSLFTDLRGDTTIDAGAVGTIAPAYGGAYGYSFSGSGVLDPRYIGPLEADSANISGGLTVEPGDGSVTISTRGDLVLADVGDPGLGSEPNTTPFTSGGVNYAGGGDGWFSLWTDATAINLFSAGGNLAPTEYQGQSEAGLGYGLYIYPSTLNAVAVSGSIYFPVVPGSLTQPMVELAPAADGQLNLLAQGSIIAADIAMSGADPSMTPTPFNPAFAIPYGFNIPSITNVNPNTYGYGYSGSSFFTFGPDTPTTDLHADDPDPIRIYAATGDIVGLDFGAVLNFQPQFYGPRITPSTWYIGAKAADIIAGGDIVLAGAEIPSAYSGSIVPTFGFILNDNPTDVSLMQAGRNIIYSGMQIGGPGEFVVQAGDNYYAANQASLVSVGAVYNVNQQSNDTGAGITLLAGVGASGPDYAAFANQYLNPANAAIPSLPIDGQPGKAIQTADALAQLSDLYSWVKVEAGYSGNESGALAFFNSLPASERAKFPSNPALFAWLKTQGYIGDQGDALAYFLGLPASQQSEFTYNAVLTAWLEQNYGYTGSETDAYAYFETLPALQQDVFLRQVYFDELNASGLDFNNPAVEDYKTYVRGKQAIATLFPTTDANGDPIVYAGDVTMFGASGIHTEFGGAIETLTPGGQTIVGVEGATPPGSAGVITQGTGDIDMYSLGSVSLGESRIMTTFGGNIVIWSATGNIDAGKGSKTTLVYTPPLRTYDTYGNVTLSPQVPSTGAGIATLNPIPQVPPGALNLVAPEGIVDAGEAGIRVSGSFNVAALQVVNTANITVQGASVGIPVVTSPNVGALTTANSAAGAVQAAIAPPATNKTNNIPSIIIVDVVGYGGGDGDEDSVPEPSNEKRKQQQGAISPPAYNDKSAVQIAGYGALSAAEAKILTPAEKEKLSRH